MKLIIIRIDNGIVTCELEDGTIIDIAQRWFVEPLMAKATGVLDISNKNVKNRVYKQ